MNTTYHYKGGQSVRQNQDCGIHEVVITCKKTNLEEITGRFGQDNYTGNSWANDLKTVKRWAKEWSYYPKKIKFTIVEE